MLGLAKERGLFLLFEASVGGGIPLLRPLTNCLSANRIDAIYGIVNGTTNYILTQMIHCGESFDDALREAQKLGYAEADPTSDVEGYDASRKIAILTSLHDFNQALELGDRFFFMKDGRIRCTGGSEIVTKSVIREIFDAQVRIVEIEGKKIIINGGDRT